jgi:hypothetical protein
MLCIQSLLGSKFGPGIAFIFFFFFFFFFFSRSYSYIPR